MVVLVIGTTAVYNGLVRRRNACRNAFAQIDVQLTRRRRVLSGPEGNQNLAQLSEELTSTENRVAFARRGYNEPVMAYNNKCEVFPANLIAGTFGFTPAALLEIGSPEAREVPRISF